MNRGWGGRRSNWREANTSNGNIARDLRVAVSAAERSIARNLTSRAPIALLRRVSAMNSSRRLSHLRVRPLAGNRARGWLTAGPLRIPCALGPAGIVRIKREGDKGTPAGRFRLLWGYYRPDRVRLRVAGAPLTPLRRDQGWCEDPSSPRYNRPVRLPARDCTDRMWREDHLYDLTFVLDQNFSRRAKGRGSAIFFHLARPGLHADRRLHRDFRRRHAEACPAS